MENLEEALIYVGTYRKYNEGSIFGAWLKLSDYSDTDEFYKACRELHKDEDDPEFMFQDWEYIPESLIGESWLSGKFFELRDAMEDLDDTEQEAFDVWLGCSSHNLERTDADRLVVNFRDDYQGAYDSEDDFAGEYADETMEIPEHIAPYFDYQAFARCLFSSDFYYESGFVFLFH